MDSTMLTSNEETDMSIQILTSREFGLRNATVAAEYDTTPANLLTAIDELPAWRRQMNLVNGVNSVGIAIDGRLLRYAGSVDGEEDAARTIKITRERGDVIAA